MYTHDHLQTIYGNFEPAQASLKRLGAPKPSCSLAWLDLGFDSAPSGLGAESRQHYAQVMEWRRKPEYLKCPTANSSAGPFLNASRFSLFLSYFPSHFYIFSLQLLQVRPLPP